MLFRLLRVKVTLSPRHHANKENAKASAESQPPMPECGVGTKGYKKAGRGKRLLVGELIIKRWLLLALNQLGVFGGQRPTITMDPTH